MKQDKIIPTEAAIIMGTSPQFVRIGLQTGKLPIGCAIKMSNRWTYNISKNRLAAYVGRDIDDELREIRKQQSKNQITPKRNELPQNEIN